MLAAHNVENWTFEIEKVEFLLSLYDEDHSPDQVYALLSAATALLSPLRGKMVQAVMDQADAELDPMAFAPVTVPQRMAA